MNLLVQRRALRWLVPAAIAAVAVLTPVLGKALLADAAPALPDKTAEELLTKLADANTPGLSGTVVYHADLGLPALSNEKNDFAALTSGTYTMRVWQKSPEKTRVALLSELGECDFIRNGDDIWTWSSDTNTATKYPVPANTPAPTPSQLPKTPSETAQGILSILGPNTDISTDGTARVAGRDAYELVLKPKDPTSKIGSVRLAIDAKEYAPLQIRINAKDSAQPALSIGYTNVDFSIPGDEQFEFTPPKHAKIIEPPASQPTTEPADRTVGESWNSVLVLDPTSIAGLAASHTRDDPSASQHQGADIASLLEKLPEASGDWGSGRTLSTRLFSVLVLDNGTTLIGAVELERLYEVAGTLK